MIVLILEEKEDIHHGQIELNEGDILYFYVGEHPENKSTVGGYNGGGNGNTGSDSNGTQTGYAGGGATDVRLINGNPTDFDSLKTRIMVAAGGGGTGIWEKGPSYGTKGDAGGISGYDGSSSDSRYANDYIGLGATQTSAGQGKTTFNVIVNAGGFGYGGYNNLREANLGGSAGGSGYYGGGASTRGHGSGGGGSSFISGHTGCIAIDYTLSTSSSNIVHLTSGDISIFSYNGNEYIFNNTIMIDGHTSMTSPTGTIEVGHIGNGYARITIEN